MPQNMLALLGETGKVVDWVETSMTMEEAIDLDRMLREQGVLTGKQEVFFTKREDKIYPDIDLGNYNSKIKPAKNFGKSRRRAYNEALTLAREEFPESASKIQEFMELAQLEHEDYGLNEKGRERLEELREDKDILEFLDFIQK